MNEVQQVVLEDFVELNFFMCFYPTLLKYRAKILFSRYVSSSGTVYSVTLHEF